MHRVLVVGCDLERRSIATKVCEEALDRIAFMYDVEIEVADETDHNLSPIGTARND